MPNPTSTEALREASGRVTFPASDRLTTFFYLLLRQGLPFGEIEVLVQEVEADGEDENVFTNGWLANYAKNLADRVRPKYAPLPKFAALVDAGLVPIKDE